MSSRRAGSRADRYLGFPAIWLRDNCPCPACRAAGNDQKLFQVTDLAPELAISAVGESGDTVTLTFAPDGHRSAFSRRWLESQRPSSPGDGRTERSKLLWTAADLGGRLPATPWSEYVADPRARLAALRAVQQVGATLLTGTPLRPGSVLEVVASFGYVRRTNYGELFDVRVEASPSNLAFTGLPVALHTDNPYRDPVPTLQLLHCLSNAVDGGESGLVDGYRAASLLREEDASAFATLAGTLVPFAWSDGENVLRSRRPLIEVDPEGSTRTIRFNNRSMQALRLDHDALAAFYRAYRRFAEVIDRRGLRIDFRLLPGDCLVFDNRRVLHARTGFSESAVGSRHLQGCYADVDGLLSTVEVLERQLGAGGGRGGTER